MRRVVITGVGAVTPLANGAALTWEKLIAGQSGIRAIDAFDVSDLAAKIAGMVPLQTAEAPKQPDLFDASDYLEPKEQRKIDRFILYAIAAADEAVKDSGWQPTGQEDRERTGVTIGAGIGGLSWIYDTSVTLLQQGARRVSPFFIPASLINLAAGQVSIRHGFQGPNHAVVTACATGAHSIGDAARMIMLGDAEVMVAGGAEAAVCRAGVAGFAAARALSTSFNDMPAKASRPWDKDRDGFVMGEGAGVVVLEEYEHAKKRGAKIYAEVLGYGMSGDAHHITSPAEDGGGAYRAMRAALKSANLSVEDIGYINAHGTSTPAGDIIEIKAMKRLFGDYSKNLAISSTKSAIGHLLGAAGAVESIFSIFAMQQGIVPPTLNLDNPSDGCDLNLVPHKAQEKKLNYVMSNSFGFGGTNASLIFGRAP